MSRLKQYFVFGSLIAFLQLEIVRDISQSPSFLYFSFFLLGFFFILSFVVVFFVKKKRKMSRREKRSQVV